MEYFQENDPENGLSLLADEEAEREADPNSLNSKQYLYIWWGNWFIFPCFDTFYGEGVLKQFVRLPFIIPVEFFVVHVPNIEWNPVLINHIPW